VRSYGSAFRLDDRESRPFDRYQHSRTSSVGRSLQGYGVGPNGSKGVATVSEQPMARFRIVSGVRCGRRSDWNAAGVELTLEGGKPYT
jgi:hypothetical protein